MKIQPVVLCHNYSDFLELTLPHNRPQFADIMVVTHPDDSETQRVAKAFDCSVLLTTTMVDGNCKFNRGRALNAGLDLLSPEDWRLVLDADIVLPPYFSAAFDSGSVVLDPKVIYGIYRQVFRTPEQYQSYLKTNRLVSYIDSSVCIGFFQLFHPSYRPPSGLPPKYIETTDGAAQTDVSFKNLWPLADQRPLPQMVSIHLGPTDQNWYGRKSPAFKLPST